MMKAIQVKYIPATNNNGARLKAFIESGMNTIIDLPYDLEHGERELVAATKLMKELNWDNVEISGQGGLPNGDYVFTLRGKS